MESNPTAKVKSDSLLQMARKMQQAGNLEPKIEDLVNKINKIEQAKHLINEELQDYNMQNDAAQRDLDELNANKLHLEEVLNTKQETMRLLQLQCDKKEAENQRQQELSDNSKQRIEELTSKIQEEKLKHRKQRMEFEMQLQELLEKHKGLREFHNEKTLKMEIAQMEGVKQHLVNEESECRCKLREVQKAMDTLKEESTTLSAEDAFLRSIEAETAVHSFEEENSKAKGLLEEVSKQHSDVLEKCVR